MKRVFLAATALLAIWASAQIAKADTVTGLDPLHFTCSNCAIDNGVVTPTTGGSPVGITVTDSGNGPTGLAATDFLLKVLIPNNDVFGTSDLTGTIGGNPIPAGTSITERTGVGGVTQWTTGDLETGFFGFTLAQGGSPPNPIDAFLPSTQGVDPNASGYFVFALDLGALNIPAQGQGGTSPFSLGFSTDLPAGSIVLGDACSSGTFAAATCQDVTTAQSAALFVTPAAVPGPIAGAGIPGLVAASLSMLALARRRFNRWRDWRIASA